MSGDGSFPLEAQGEPREVGRLGSTAAWSTAHGQQSGQKSCGQALSEGRVEGKGRGCRVGRQEKEMSERWGSWDEVMALDCDMGHLGGQLWF